MDKFKNFPWDRYFMLMLAGLVYFNLALYDPEIASAAIYRSIEEIKKLLLPLTLAIFFGGSARVLLKHYTPSSFLNGKNCLFSASSVGSFLPPCPFISYPVIQGFWNGGLSQNGLLLMLITTTLVEVTQLFAGLAVFGVKIVLLRIFFAFLGSILVGVFLLSFSKPLQTGPEEL